MDCIYSIYSAYPGCLDPASGQLQRGSPSYLYWTDDEDLSPINATTRLIREVAQLLRRFNLNPPGDVFVQGVSDSWRQKHQRLDHCWKR